MRRAATRWRSCIDRNMIWRQFPFPESPEMTGAYTEDNKYYSFMFYLILCMQNLLVTVIYSHKKNDKIQS